MLYTVYVDIYSKYLLGGLQSAWLLTLARHPGQYQHSSISYKFKIYNIGAVTGRSTGDGYEQHEDTRKRCLVVQW